ncbi:MAG: hypothetical protein JNM30_11450 [Rhodospirillales bacterium]|nr:hypothetical protein [Rhodospirillales bacterium]
MTTLGPVPPPLPPPPSSSTTSATPSATGTGATPTPSAPTVTANAVQALTAVIVNLPNTLRSRPAGSPVTGTLVAQDANSNALVRTNDGVVVLRGPINLPLGSQVALTLPDQPDGGLAKLTLLRLPDGTAPNNAALTPVTPGTPRPGALAGLPGQIAPGAGGLAPTGQANGGTAVPIAAGQVLSATLAQRAAPEAVNPAYQRYGAAPIGATFDVRVLNVVPPGIEGAAPRGIAIGINAAGHPVVNAQVIGQTGSGLVVVNAGFGLLTVPSGGVLLAAGAQLQLEFLGRPPPGAPGQPPPGQFGIAPAVALAEFGGRPPGDAGTLAHDWETLRRTIEALVQQNPQAAQSALGRAVAQPGDRLAAGLLFLVAAMRGGDIGALLGEPAIRSLERAGRGGLLRRLNDELGVLNKLATEASGEWRAFFLPVQPPDGPITPVRMFFRQPRKNQKQGEQATRFVVETELTRLGPIQIDGLAKATRLDLILRTREALPAEAQTEIDRIFQSAAADGRFTGSIGFQAVERFPIDPLEEIGHPVHGVTA